MVVDLKRVVGRDSNAKTLRLNQEVDLFEITKDAMNVEVDIRLVGPLFSYADIWVPFVNSKGEKKSFNKIISGIDPYTGERLEKDLYEKFANKNDIYVNQYFLCNGIMREEQEVGGPFDKGWNASEKELHRFPKEMLCEEEFHFKDINNRVSKTPVKVIKMTKSFAQALLRKKSKNKHDNEVFDLYDIDWGRDITVSHLGKGKYDLELTEGTKQGPITDEELDYLYYNDDPKQLESLTPDSLDKQEEEIESWAKRGIGVDPNKAESVTQVPSNYKEDVQEKEPPVRSIRRSRRERVIEDEDSGEDVQTESVDDLPF